MKPVIAEETKLEVTRRVKGGVAYDFIINLTGEEQPLPACYAGKTDMLTGRGLKAGAALKPWDALLVCEG